ncbi:MAG: hypothetical protein PVH60_04040 [Anaerolineales bacterium]
MVAWTAVGSGESLTFKPRLQVQFDGVPHFPRLLQFSFLSALRRGRFVEGPVQPNAASLEGGAVLVGVIALCNQEVQEFATSEMISAFAVETVVFEHHPLTPSERT